MAVKIYGSLEINEYVEAEGALSESDGGILWNLALGDWRTNIMPYMLFQ